MSLMKTLAMLLMMTLPFALESFAQDRKDSPGDAMSRPAEDSPLILDNPDNVEVTYELSEDGQGYYVYEQVGGRNVRPPSYITREEYIKRKERESRKSFMREQAEAASGGPGTSVEGSVLQPEINVDSKAFETIFGSSKVDIQPNVNITLELSIRRNVNLNPSLAPIQQRPPFPGVFNFDQQIQMNVVGSIGERLNLNVNYDTKATFNFENQFRIAYQGDEDAIIKSIEAGNVSLPLNGTLITGGQNLWGIKVATQFGPVFVTTIASQQRGQTQEIVVSGGAPQTPFEKKVGQYDENRHFFLSHSFRNQYESALRNLPIMTSKFTVSQVEVWVKNINNREQQNLRNAVGLIDLGENNPAQNEDAGRIYNPAEVRVNPQFRMPANEANNLYQQLRDDPEARNTATTRGALEGMGLSEQDDYEVVDAMRKLTPNEYKLNSQLGYITLNQRLNPNDVLFVAFEYTDVTTGRTFRVGEFSNNQPTDENNSNVLFLKMLKPSQNRPGRSYQNPDGAPYPTWDLMMKNVYNIGGSNLQPEGFDIEIVYEATDGSGDINFLPTSNVNNIPLIQLFQVDNLTNNSELGFDNNFDFLDGRTVIADKGLVVFPTLEPFGDFLVETFEDGLARPQQRDAAEIDSLDRYIDEYAYTQLYDFTQADAVNYYPNLNRFKFKGNVAGQTSSEIYLNSVQVAPGSVKVTAGGVQLQEGLHYSVDYNIGKVTILDASLLNAGQDVRVTFESNTLFGIDQKTLLGSRVDYRISDNLQLGGTILYLNERPLVEKILINSEPVSNVIWGLDVAYDTESRLLTRLVDKLPFYSTSSTSRMSVAGEFAHLMPGINRRVRNGSENGIAYIDDFEGTRNVIDLTSFRFWRLASVPEGYLSQSRTRQILDRYADNDSLHPRYLGYTRAKLSWYLIDFTFFDRPDEFGFDESDPLSPVNAPYTRRVEPNEIFPERTVGPGTNILSTFDLHYDPRRRGQYNYQADEEFVNQDGLFRDPESNWAGIMRLTSGNTDFEAANIEFIEFWLMDPFIDDDQGQNEGVDLFFNLGRVSEDVLPDSRRAVENGLPPGGGQTGAVDETPWGRVPSYLPPTNAFDNDPASRENQDVGLDGLRDEDEATFYADFLENIGYMTPAAQAELRADPSSDNYDFFRDFDQGVGIIERYRNFNGMEGNSPINDGGDEFSRMSTPNPDLEDLNADGQLFTAESYFEYQVSIRKEDLEIGKNFIVDTRDTLVKLPMDPDGEFTGIAKWYLFRIPLRPEDQNQRTRVGEINDLKAVDFVRMYLANGEDPITLRFGKLELVSTQWRTFFSTEESGPTNPCPPGDCPEFEIGTLNVEENGEKLPFNYVIPPGIRRQDVPGSPVDGILQNEQSFVMKTQNLPPGEERGAFRMVDLDLRNYKNVKLWLHAERPSLSPCDSVGEPDPYVFVRLGTDLTQNYYEYQIPVERSDELLANPHAPENVWLNDIVFQVPEMQAIKALRNSQNYSFDEVFPPPDEAPLATYRIKGNPRLDNVKNVMVGIRNQRNLPSEQDSTQLVPNNRDMCLEVWVNELRVTNFDTKNAWATNARMNLKLADLANLSASATYATPRFGGVEQRINERSQEEVFQYDLALNLQAGKLFPESFRLEVPVFVTYGERIVTPRFNPIDPDLELDAVVEASEQTPGVDPDSLRNASIDYTRNFSYAFTNVRRRRAEGQKIRPWDFENLAFSWGYTDRFHRSAQIQYQRERNWTASIGYGFSFNPKPVRPLSFIKAKWLSIISDFNFTPLPRQVTIRLDARRRLEEEQRRPVARGIIEPTFTKDFTLNRVYSVQWDLTQSLRLTYDAMNRSRIDEPPRKEPQDTLGNTLNENLLYFGEEPERLKFNRINLGRTIAFNQRINASYSLPLRKIKPLNWVNVNVNYQATYDWQSAQVQNFAYQGVPSLGHNISNQRTISTSASFQMATLYKKYKFIDKILEPIPKRTKISLADSSRTMDDDLFIAWKRTYKFIAAWVFSIQNIDINYTINQGTVLPGYLPRTDNFGLDWNYSYEYTDPNTGTVISTGKTTAPGLDFILGHQPLAQNPEEWLTEAARRGWFSHNQEMLQGFTTQDSRNLNIRTQLTPFKGFRMDVTFERRQTENVSGTFFFDLNASPSERYDNYNLTSETGTFSMSYLTLFTAFDQAGESKGFDNLTNNRRVISRRFSETDKAQLLYQRYEVDNVIFTGADNRSVGNYANGYTGASQQVLIPAFLSAYGSYNESKIKLSPFQRMPFPNWQINYSGLSKWDLLEDLVQTITLRHSYRSTYSISYVRNLTIGDDNFQDDTLGYGTGLVFGQEVSAVDFLPELNIQSVSINEQFSPLFGINIAWKNGMSTNFNLNRQRRIMLNVGPMQINESRITDISLDFSWRRDQGLFQSMTLFGKEMNMSNTITYRLQFSIRNERVVNQKLDSDIPTEPTRGGQNITINPSVDYVVSSQLTVQIFYKHIRNNPFVSNSFPTRFSEFGFRVQFTL